MPERPDLDYVVPILAKQVVGLSICSVRVRKPVVLRITLPGTPQDLLQGLAIRQVRRRAHFVVFELNGSPPLDLVISPMLAGRFSLGSQDACPRSGLAVAWGLSDGRELRYFDDVQMGKVYVIEQGRYDMVPGLSSVGIDVLDPRAFSREAFRAIARTRRDQAKVCLMDKTALDSMGNAYADEVLFEAGIHPKAWMRNLSLDEVDRLHDAIVAVLAAATSEIRARQPPLEDKIRDFLKVRGKPGAPCPNCGTTLRRAGVHGHDAIFCPQCQVDRRRTGIVDWRNLKPATPSVQSAEASKAKPQKRR